MSIHRVKRPTFRRPPEPRPADRPAPAPVELPEWAQAVAGKPEEAFVAYAPAASYAPGALLAHVKFGRGIVLAVDGAKVSVLFEQGLKKLVHAAP